MNLKPIVASMLVLASVPVVAAASDNANTQAQLDAMKANVAKLQSIVDQNNPGGFAQPDNWWNRITLSGQVLVDGAFSNRNATTATGNPRAASPGNSFVQYSGASTFNVDSANLFIDANVSDYTRAHVDLAYTAGALNSTHYYQIAQVNPNEAYVVLGNFNKYPFYLMAGQQYVQFGEYDRYPLVYSFTQLLSQTQQVAATAGFIDAGTGINAAVFGFKGLSPLPGATVASVQQIRNYGGKLGIKNTYDNWGYGASVDYLNNMADVQYFGTVMTNYRNAVHGIAFDGDLTGGPFDAKLRYVQALNHFVSGDVNYWNNGTVQGEGAKPWAAGLDLGYGFLAMQHQSRVGISYQQSGQTSAVGTYGLPQNRYEAQYIVNVSRFTDLGFDLYYDKDWGASQGGTDNNATTGVIRLGVKFA